MGNITISQLGLMFRSSAAAPTYDADAQAYITAVESTGYAMPTAEKNAVNAYVLALKANGTWTKKHAVYLYSGNTAASQKWNLKNPQDTDVAFRITWFGTPTHSAAGVKFNGDPSGSYGETHMPASTVGHSSILMAVYATSERAVGSADEVEIGVKSDIGGVFYDVLMTATPANQFVGQGFGAGGISIANPSSIGLHSFVLTGTTRGLYKNGNLLISDTATDIGNSSTETRTLWIGALHYSGGNYGISTKNLNFTEIAQSHTSTEILNDYYALMDYLIAIGRIDADVVAYINAVQSTGYVMPAVEKVAVYEYVLALKANGTWAKKKAVYLYSGNTAASQKWNLKDPRDLDAAFRIIWNGVPVHSSMGLGFTGNNTTYADTRLSVETLGNFPQLGIYSTVNRPGAEEVDIGVQFDVSGTKYYTAIVIRRPDGLAYGDTLNLGTPEIPAAVPDTVGLITTNLLGTTRSLYRNAVLLNSDTPATVSSTGHPETHWIGAIPINGVYGPTTKTYVFTELSQAHTATEILNDYNALTDYLISVGRISDPDANAYIAAVQGTGYVMSTAEKNAIILLALNLKANGTWTKKHAIYPMTGNTAASQSFNLKNPAQYQLTYSGTIAHSASGMKFNAASSSYADTHLTDTVLGLSSMDIGIWGTDHVDADTIEAGVSSNASEDLYIHTRKTNGQFTVIYRADYVQTYVATSMGLSRLDYDGTNMKSFKDGVLMGAKPSPTQTSGSITITLGAINQPTGPGVFSNKTIGYAEIGKSETDAEIGDDYLAINRYMIAIGRASAVTALELIVVLAFLSAAGIILTPEQILELNEILLSIEANPAPGFAPAISSEYSSLQELPYEVTEYLRSEGFNL